MAAFAASLPVFPPYQCRSMSLARPPLRLVLQKRYVQANVLSMTAAPTDSDIRIRLYGNNIAITQSLSDYVDKKIGKVIRKYKSYCTKVDVHLSVQPSVPAGQACEVVVFCGKNILRREVRSADMYASIDEVEEKLGRTMRKFKERKEAKKGKVAPVDSSVFVDVSDDSDDDMDDTFAPSVSDEIASLMPNVDGLVKRKSFPLPLQTVEEAILCLEYIDHSFYLFKLKDTGKVSLVYRRNNGGFGLIEPNSDDEAM